MTEHQHAKPPMQITGRMVLIGFIIFFGVIAAVNGVFMYLALDTWPGLTTQDAYKKGLNYNATLKAQEVQRRLGWQVGVDLIDGNTLTVSITDSSKVPLSGLDVRASVSRPLGDSQSTLVTFTEATSGHYVAAFQAPSAGRWKVDLTVQATDGAISETRHEIRVEP